MSDLEATAAADATAVLASVPAWLWDGERLPVPVEQIVDSRFGLLVRDVEDLTVAPGAPELAPGQSLSGLLLAGAGEIWVNAAEAREWPPRRRFTLSHELGHWIMHAHRGETIWCRSPMVAPEDPIVPDPRPPLPLSEIAANAFAAELLMPAHRVVELHAQLRGDFEALMAAFDVSGAALERRLRKLGLAIR